MKHIIKCKPILIQAWDADEGLNAQIRYFLNFLSTPEISEQVFEMNQDTGDVGLKVPLSDLAGNTFHVSWCPALDKT